MEGKISIEGMLFYRFTVNLPRIRLQNGLDK